MPLPLDRRSPPPPAGRPDQSLAPSSDVASAMAIEERRVEEQSAGLKRQLRLPDLVLQQVVYVVGTTWVGVAAKLGHSQMVYWLAAMLLFYIPQALVVSDLSRRMPLE